MKPASKICAAFVSCESLFAFNNWNCLRRSSDRDVSNVDRASSSSLVGGTRAGDRDRASDNRPARTASFPNAIRDVRCRRCRGRSHSFKPMRPKSSEPTASKLSLSRIAGSFESGLARLKKPFQEVTCRQPWNPPRASTSSAISNGFPHLALDRSVNCEGKLE